MCLHEALVVAVATLPEGPARDDIMDQRAIPSLLTVHSGSSSAADLLHI